MRLTEVLLLVPAALAFAQAPVSPPPGVCSIRLLEMKPPAVDPHFEIATPDPKQFASLNVKPPAPPCPGAQSLRSVPPPAAPPPAAPAPEAPAPQSPAAPPAPAPAK